MKFFKLKPNDDSFKFDSLEFTDDLKLTDDSKNKLVLYLNALVDVVDCPSQKDFISIISEDLKLDNQSRIGNTIDVGTTNKKIFQMCYLEENVFDKDAKDAEDAEDVENKDEKKQFNFLATIMNTKRKMINGDVFIFSNSLLTTKLTQKSNILEYIKPIDMNIDDLIEVLLNNYYFSGICFDGSVYYKYLFDNNLTVVVPESIKGTKLSELTFRRSELLNFTIDIFYDKNENKNENDSKSEQAKQKYNQKLGLFYVENFTNKIFISLKSESNKNYDSILDDYINKLLHIYDKYCFDDDELRVPKELKFYDYQSSEKYTNKYIVFDNLYDQVL
jgi:hypothetical protein